MKQDKIVSRIYDRIWETISDWFESLVLIADKEELLKDLELFRSLYNAVKFQYETNKMETPDDINKVYEVLEDVFKKLGFNQDEIEEMMYFVKMLDREHLKELLHDLEREFKRASRDIEDYLEELDEYEEEELEE